MQIASLFYLVLQEVSLSFYNILLCDGIKLWAWAKL